MSADYPFNGLATPANINMLRYQYDSNNDGIVDNAQHAVTADSAGSFVAQVGVRISGGYLEIVNTGTGLFHRITITGAANQETIHIGDGTV